MKRHSAGVICAEGGNKDSCEGIDRFAGLSARGDVGMGNRFKVVRSGIRGWYGGMEWDEVQVTERG